MNGPTTNGPDASTTDHASAVLAAMPGWRRLLSMVLTAAIVTSAVGAGVGGLSGTAAAKSSFSEDEMKFCEDPVTDRVDEDGDGYLESFTVCVKADTIIQESPIGKKDIPENHASIISEGHPKFAYFGVIEKDGKKRPILLGINEVEPSGIPNVPGIEHEIDIQQQVEKRNLFLEDHEIKEIRVMYVESDSGPNALVLKDVDTINAIASGAKGTGKIAAGTALLVSGAVPAGISAIGSSADNWATVAKSIKKAQDSDEHIDTDAHLLSDPIRMEHPNDARTATVEVTSNAENAEVLIDGERVGTTPWSGEYPVDHADRSGRTTITVDDTGYVSESKTVNLSPPESLHFDLDRVEMDVGPDLDRIEAAHPDTIAEDAERIEPGSTLISPGTGNAAPEAGMTVSTQRPVTGDRVIFNASPSSDPEGSLARYEWDVDGDGRTDATGRTANHTYADPGAKQVTLTVTDSAGNTDSAVRTLDVSRPNAQPQARFDVQQGTGRTVTVDASASHDPDGTVRNYTWKFGDGGTASGETVTYSYSRDGTYTVRLLVTDDRNATSTASETVSVSAEPDTPDRSESDPTPDGEPENENSPESNGERTPTPPESEDPGSPGFGIGVGLSALGAAALLAARRLLAG